MVKVLFVCTGNICRSPTAEGVMRTHLERLGLDGAIQADSAGTHGYHVGEPPDQRSILTARCHGVEIASQRARKVEVADFEEFDLVLALDHGHLSHLRKLCPKPRTERLAMLMSFAEGSEDPEDVPDPYYGVHGFEDVYGMIDRAVVGLIAHIRKSYPLEVA